MSDVPLKEYFESILRERQEYFERLLRERSAHVDQRFALNDLAIEKAERSMNERLNGMNEFRDALKDQTARMATRAELDALATQVQDIRREKANLDGRIVVVVGVVSVVVSLAMILMSRLFIR